MQSFLRQKHIVLGITGGIAAYKAAELARRLRDQGAIVRVVMTASAKEFITPLTLQAVSGHPVHDDLFDLSAEAAMGHIELARWADAILVAPASADFMARVLSGEANDLLTTLCLATKAPIALAPAMNQAMWQNPTTQQNATRLKEKGITLLGPAEGSQACGDVGPGRMMEPLALLEGLSALFGSGRLSGKQVLITAGPTREAIDPVRYLTNASSGKMGYALATSAREAGASVTLITGPTHLEKPFGVETIPVISANEMYDKVMQEVAEADIFLSVAAVADYCVETIAQQKIAKSAETMTLTLKRNPDILKCVAALEKRPFVVGFAAETDNVITKAKEKLKQKNCDLIIANEVGSEKGFDQEENAATALWKNEQREFPRTSKTKLAKQLIDLIAELLPLGDNNNGRSD